jgi:hypothetical protein
MWVLFVAAIGWAAWHYGAPAVQDMRTKNNSSSHYTPCMVGDYIAC